jgi:CheY-like chemotaxis protein
VRTGYVGDRRRVWVVDNEEADRGLLVRILEPLGFDVTPLASGLECLSLLRSCPQDHEPHAVLMDLAMPGIDGWTTVRTIRQEGLSRAPVAIVSANAFDKGLDNDVGVAPEDFIVKPVRVSELLDWLGRRLTLQWIEVQRPTASKPTLEATLNKAAEHASQVLPSLKALQSLEELIDAGYVRGVHKALDQIAAAEPQCDAFVQNMRQLARQFQLDALAEVVRQALARFHAQSSHDSDA